ncbi:hypothetical protein [Dactylosporangium sp. CA-233914]|uniref:hypothetical protein n=1 Tax=Dactylosporangium sp. CA-233914 TaxID=3239934 RepID=UPI003D91DE6D
MSEHSSGFVVDPRALETFGLDFQHDLDAHLSSEKVQTLHIFSEAQLFGSGTASPDVHQAATDYRSKLLELFDTMDALLHEGAVMARAAQAIANAYAEADAISDDDVHRAVGVAQQQTDADALVVDPVTGRPV